MSRAERNAAESDRRAADPDRKRRHSEYMREWRMKNPEAARAIDRRKRERHAERLRERDRVHYEKNKDHRIAQAGEWKRNNPEKQAVYRATRRAKKIGNGGTLSPGIVDRLITLQRGLCACCGESLKSGYHLDHIVPLALGGHNSDDNVQLLTPRCNMQKSARHPIEFMQDKGKLL